ncbi:MAG: response regulator [candidate division Zixibacteria bacterium]|nr:response regulator [candidate division Zixibacteria bacterium]
MSNTLFVDDCESLVETVKVFIEDEKIETTFCKTSLEEAQEVLKEVKDVKCVIADLVFEGSTEDGIHLLEMVKKQYPKAECILLTGYVLNDSQLNRLKKIDGKLIYKADLNEDILRKLLSGETILEGEESSYKSEVDVGELKLRYDKMNSILDEMIEDIYEELESIENQNEIGILAGIRTLSVAQLRKHLEAKDEIGTEIIKMYRSLNKRLRGSQL